ncbi:MAG: CHAT domain-containing protein, partial [Nostocales cyanobacterium 94392]|nr:CHAT domain-containing protein [Nostocales cyanobacterium 94392]
FRGVKCEYVYMRFPTKENPNPLRKPDNNAEAFADGEFGDFIQPIFDTLDLYHNQGVDPRAIAISFKELAENNPDAGLEIVAMEKRGDDKFLLRAKAAPEVNKSELSAEYFETYNYLKSLNPSEQVQYLLTELKVKDTEINSQQNQIISYENMINTALGRPNIQADTVTVQHIGGNITKNAQEKNQKDTNNSEVKTILILASNPKNTSQLRLGEEVREIDAGLQRAKKRELFDFKQRWAVRCQEVYQAFLDFKPQIVHFSGHGSGDDGLALEDEHGNLKLVDTEAIAKLFELFSTTIECVVLNACYSEVQASAIAKYIPYVIGMNQAIGDKAAIKFATGFYNALGAGENIEFAYKLGCNVIQLDGIAEHLTPVLKKR